MSNKAKGSKNERELYSMFIENHFRAVRVAGSGTMEMDLSVIEGIYAGTVNVTRTSEGYKVEGNMPSYGRLEDQMKSRLRVRMNADVDNDRRITPEEVRNLKSYLIEKVAKEN